MTTAVRRTGRGSTTTRGTIVIVAWSKVIDGSTAPHTSFPPRGNPIAVLMCLTVDMPGKNDAVGGYEQSKDGELGMF